MSKMQRDKGKRGEREVAKIIREAGFPEARRGQQFCGRNGDADVVGLPKIHLEVKRTETARMYEYYDQAVSDSKEKETPVVVWRKNEKNWLAVLDFEDFLDIYKKAYPEYWDNDLIG